MKRIQEDWVIVISGILIIAFFMAGLTLDVPEFQWNDLKDLSEKIFAPGNLMALLFLLLFLSCILLTGNLLSEKPVKYLLNSFPAIFIITILSLILAGSAPVRSLNIEGVLISLFAGLAITLLPKVKT